MSTVHEGQPVTEPIDMTPLLSGTRRPAGGADHEDQRPPGLRSRPEQWHRRGLRSPDEIAAIVSARLAEVPRPASPPADGADDLAYGDFFAETPA